jgi:hypothetical protein
MRDKAAHACRALCRARVVAEMYQRRGTRLAEHLKLVLSIIDRAGPTGGASGVEGLITPTKPMASGDNCGDF